MDEITEQNSETPERLFVRRNIGDNLLASIYLQFELEGALDTIYYQAKPTLYEFLSYHRNPANVWLGGFIERAGQVELAGLGWVNSINTVLGHTRAEVGLAFLKRYQTHGLPQRLTELMLEFCFTHLKVDALYGTMPVENRAVVLFNKRLGFEQFGPVPGYCMWKGAPTGAIIGALTRERWEQLRREKA